MTEDPIDLEIARHWQRLTDDERAALVAEIPDEEAAVLAAALESVGIAS